MLQILILICQGAEAWSSIAFGPRTREPLDQTRISFDDNCDTQVQVRTLVSSHRPRRPSNGPFISRVANYVALIGYEDRLVY